MTKTLDLPAEVKDGKRWVALDPHAVAMLFGVGLKALVKQADGAATGFADTEYRAAGADLVSHLRVRIIIESTLAMMLQLALEAQKRWHRITAAERLGELIERVRFVDGVAQLAA